MSDERVLEVSIHVSARPEIVFAYFTDPARYRQWMGSTVEFDPRPGGVYRVGIRDGVEALGQFVEIEPPRRLVFTWGWTGRFEVAPGSTRVEVTLAAEDGGTRVVLRHYDLPDDEARGQHRVGWQLYLRRLAARASGGDPGPDPNA